MTFLKNWWDRLLFRDRGILPTPKLILLLITVSAILLLLSFWYMSLFLVMFTIAILIGISLVDLFFSPKRNQIEAARFIDSELERQKNHEIMVRLYNHSRFPGKVRFIDQIPVSFQTIFPSNQLMGAATTTEVVYHVFPLERGQYTIQKLYIRYKSSFGLWEKQKTLHLEQTVKVLPNLTQTHQYLTNAQRYLLHEGIKIKKQKSGAGEFSKIRSYVVGDDPRKINWRQSAKLQTIMTNEYEPEHGKYITLLIDCGRMMGVELTKDNRLEKVLEATIATATAALKNGDYVSVVAFSKKIHAYVSPAKGLAHLDTILHAIYNLQVDPSESNYTNVLHYVRLKQKKRSMFLLFSDVDTFLHEETILQSLRQLRRKHLFLIIGIENEQLQYKQDCYPHSVQQAMEKAIAQKANLFKTKQIRKWGQQGFIILEAPEDRLAVTAISFYIDQLNRGVL